MTDDAVPGRRAAADATVLPADLTNDFRVLLTIVSGRVQLARRRLRGSEVDPGRVDADLAMAEEAVERLVAQIRRLGGTPLGDG